MDGVAQPIDYERLRSSVGKHLFRYSGEFAPYFGARASGSYVYDETGRAVLDFCSGQMCATLGHNHPAVTDAIEKSCREVVHLYSGLLSPPVVMLAEALAEILPPSLHKMMFMSTGGESNEAALRIAKLYTGGFEVLGLSGSWHGITGAAVASTYSAPARRGYGPGMAGTFALPSPNAFRCPVQHCRDACDMTCLHVGFGMYDSQSVGVPAAVLVEPIQSANGVIVPPDGYLKRLKELCSERGMLLILDEAQTGLGRLGANFAFEQDAIVPDVLTLSKTLGNGLPLAATITSDEIETDCFEKGFLFYTSHLSDPLPAAVGIAVLKVLHEEKLADRAAEMGRYFMDALRSLQQRYQQIGDVRGRGLLVGMELVKDRESRTPDREFASKLQKRCLEKGLVTHAVRSTYQSTMRFAPPLTVTTDEIDSGIAIMDQAMRELVG